MNIYKAGNVKSQRDELDMALELRAVNAFTKKDLLPEEVYVFSVLLCDNEIDRDMERFSEGTLEELSELFVGKTGIADHNWSSDMQKARIYRTELIREEAEKNSLGMPYIYLKGYAYMLRTERNAELIAEIDAGIKKETSVGCSIAKTVCSVCGEEIESDSCRHVKGRKYKGKLCFAELQGAVDAYEWSFVAVPAQKKAGVIKKLDVSKGLKGFVSSEEGRCFTAEYDRLENEAAVGRRYLEELKSEVLRLSLLSDRKMHSALKTGVAHMDEAELLGMKKAFEDGLKGRFPPITQLPGQGEVTRFDGGDYII